TIELAMNTRPIAVTCTPPRRPRVACHEYVPAIASIEERCTRIVSTCLPLMPTTALTDDDEASDGASIAAIVAVSVSSSAPPQSATPVASIPLGIVEPENLAPVTTDSRSDSALLPVAIAPAAHAPVAVPVAPTLPRSMVTSASVACTATKHCAPGTA